MVKDCDKTVLEELVDIYGLGVVVDTLSDICHEKADHIKSSYQDRTTAKPWDEAGRRLSRVKVQV